MALIKRFSKSLLSDRQLKKQAQKTGLASAYFEYCRKMAISPNELLRVGFAFRGFKRSTINKVNLTLEVELRAKGLKNGARSRSQEDIANRDGINKIKSESQTLTHQQVIN